MEFLSLVVTSLIQNSVRKIQTHIFLSTVIKRIQFNSKSLHNKIVKKKFLDKFLHISYFFLKDYLKKDYLISDTI